MGAKSKRAQKTRTGSEFNLMDLVARLMPPKGASGIFGWGYDDIVAARDAQGRGDFFRPARLAEAMRTDDALFVAYQNRLAPQRGLPVKLVAPNQTARALRVLDEAEALFGQHGVGVTSATLSDINGQLANHGEGFGVNVATPRLGGSRIDLEMHTWPIEWVRWDPVKRCHMTRIDPDSMRQLDMVQDATGTWGLPRITHEMPIIHGDGRWSIFSAHEHEPWKQEAAVLAAWSVWLRHAHGIRDWSKGSRAQGNVKTVGEMPPGVALQTKEGALTNEGQAMLDLLITLASDEMPVGVRAAGAKTELLSAGSAVWQVFQELVKSGEISGARLYLGQDGTVGTNPTGPGQDLRALFGVRNDIAESDLRTLERGILTGVIEPWAAMNFGDSSLAPRREYQIPDADEDARRKSLGERREQLFTAIEKERELGFDVTAERITALADEYGVTIGELVVVKESSKAPTIQLAPTDIAKVVKVNEARASAGLGPLLLKGIPDPDGDLTVEEFSAKKAAARAPVLPAAG